MGKKYADTGVEKGFYCNDFSDIEEWNNNLYDSDKSDPDQLYFDFKNEGFRVRSDLKELGITGAPSIKGHLDLPITIQGYVNNVLENTEDIYEKIDRMNFSKKSDEDDLDGDEEFLAKYKKQEFGAFPIDNDFDNNKEADTDERQDSEKDFRKNKENWMKKQDSLNVRSGYQGTKHTNKFLERKESEKKWKKNRRMQKQKSEQEKMH